MPAAWIHQIVSSQTVGASTRTRLARALGTLALSLLMLAPPEASAQESDDDAVATPAADDASPSRPVPNLNPEPPTVWDLTVQGGIFMIPIALCSIVVVAFTIERLIGLRRSKVMPRALVRELKALLAHEEGVDPRTLYRLCEQHPSPLASIVRGAIVKIGRPQPEVEKAVEDAGARQAATLFSNVRPLNACASLSPLLGLIGTVQGMIMAFIVTSTTTSTGTAKAQELAQGIYTALVTTFAGLCVAIPAVWFAHYFEGRIDRIVREMEDLLMEVLAQLERFEGKLRFRGPGTERRGAPTAARQEPAPQRAAPAKTPARPAAPSPEAALPVVPSQPVK